MPRVSVAAPGIELSNEADRVQSAMEGLVEDAEAAVSASGIGASPIATNVDTCGRCDTCVVERVVVKGGESAWTTLEKAHVRKADVGPALDAMRRFADLKRLYPGTELTIRRDEEGRLMSLERRPTPYVSQCVERGADGKLGGRVFELEVVTTQELIETDLGANRSIELALAERGESPMLAFQVREILSAWDDASKVSVTYDRLRLVVEKRLLGDEALGNGRILAMQYIYASGKTHQAYWWEPEAGKGGYYDKDGTMLATAWLDFPLLDPVITSGFGLRKQPFSRRAKRSGQVHLGLDFHAHRGEPVYAARDGVVIQARRDAGYGNCILIQHSNGLVTRYAHLSRYAKDTKVGAEVTRGTLIGWSGNTGWSTGPHLHFETIVAGRPVDPMRLLVPGTPSPLSEEDKKKFHQLIANIFVDEPPQEVALE